MAKWDFSILIGGKAGFGIDKSGLIIARILNQLSLRLYIYREYPSLIRGGHAFSIIRVSKEKISACSKKINIVLALNQDTLTLHKDSLKDNGIVIYDSDSVKLQDLRPDIQAIGIPLQKILKEENAPDIMRNSCIIGALAKSVGIKEDILSSALRKEIFKETDLNIKVAVRGYNEAKRLMQIEPFAKQALPLVSGSQAIALGLMQAGLKTYIAYPMTPASPLLHFLAGVAGEFSLKVIHPENEIAVILMALGFSYMGEKAAVGTSGGGFCLMAEGLSLAGMAELPLVIMVAQRPGPSTGLPTYTAQTELDFVTNAGQGEFPRFIVAPGDAEEAFFWSAAAMNISWKYQIPSIILSDKTLCEGIFNFEMDSVEEMPEEAPLLWDKKQPYKRYLDTKNGVSSLAFPPDKDAVVKANSYEHDEFGITTEEPQVVKMMQDKRRRKEAYLIEDLKRYPAVKVYGNKSASTALICWGSNKGVCVEVAQALGLRVIQPLVLWPLPVAQVRAALAGTQRLICVENNATGQLAGILSRSGFGVEEKILKYDGRPFDLEELEDEVRKRLFKTEEG